VDFGLARGDGDVDAEGLFPHGLDGFEDGNLRGGPGGEFEAREVFSVGKAGCGEQLPGFLGLVAKLGGKGDGGVATQGGAEETLGGFLSAEENAINYNAAVDGLGECAANAGVVEGRPP